MAVLLRKPRVLKPVQVVLDGLRYDAAEGVGTVCFGGRMYLLEAIRDGRRTVGLSFGPLDGTDRRHDVDFTAEFGWRCDCEDATFNGDRPGGCKHVNAARLMAGALKGVKS
jgi:hypothetical protein